MPNHITNVVESGAEVMASLMANGKPDFNAVVKRPEILNGFEPHMDVVDRAKAAMGLIEVRGQPDFMRNLAISGALRICTTPVNPNDIQEIIKAIQCYQETGCVYWHDWSVANWGTKWNAYSSDPDRCSEEKIHFETAWSYPKKVAIALSKKHPQQKIVWHFADEDMGSNCGTVTLTGGEIVGEDVAPISSDQTEEQKKKWRKFAFDLRYPGQSPEDAGMNESYEYIDE